jgi:hypothetical protein
MKSALRTNDCRGNDCRDNDCRDNDGRDNDCRDAGVILGEHEEATQGKAAKYLMTLFKSGTNHCRAVEMKE